MKKIFKNPIILIGIFVLIDFLTKLLILSQTIFPISLYGEYSKLYPHYFPISTPTSFLNIILVWNNGVSFSMLSSYTTIGKIFITLLSVLITSYIIYLLTKEKNKYNRFAFILIISGAIGNIFDRIRYGAVIDFLDFHIGSYHWPAFNLADMYICIGVGIILLNSFIKKE